MTISDLTKRAKKISIEDFLRKNGYQPVEENGSYSVFYSPLREESTPSFHVDTSGRYGFRWKDYGTGKSGDIIDLVQLMTGKSFNEALEFLSKDKTLSFFSKGHNCRKFSKPFNRPMRKVTRIKPLTNHYLKWYIKERCIPISLANKYLVELHYTYKENEYYSNAFKNDLGGFELSYKQKNRFNMRYEAKKSTIHPKSITTFKKNGKLDVFEGFWDMLSYLTFYKLKEHPNSCIVLNSTSEINKLLPVLKDYRIVNTFLDNDQAGINATKLIMENHNNVRDWRQKIYPGYNDFNDFICELYK